MNALANGYIRLKGQELLEAKGMNLHQVSHEGAFTYSTVHRYIRYPEKVNAMSTRVLYGFLVEGLGINPSELENMRFGEIFDVVPDCEEQSD